MVRPATGPRLSGGGGQRQRRGTVQGAAVAPLARDPEEGHVIAAVHADQPLDGELGRPGGAQILLVVHPRLHAARDPPAAVAPRLGELEGHVTVGDQDVRRHQEAGADPLQARMAVHLDAADAQKGFLDRRALRLQHLPVLGRRQEPAVLDQEGGAAEEEDDGLEADLLGRRERRLRSPPEDLLDRAVPGGHGGLALGLEGPFHAFVPRQPPHARQGYARPGPGGRLDGGRFETPPGRRTGGGSGAGSSAGHGGGEDLPRIGGAQGLVDLLERRQAGDQIGVAHGVSSSPGAGWS